MTHVIGLDVSLPTWPVVGDHFPVAVMFTLHIAVAELSLGLITLAAFFETRALRTGNAWHLRYARAASNTYYLIFSLGATLAVFAVTIIIGLWGPVWGVLLNRFFALFGIAFGLFFIIVPLLVVYRNSWERMAPRRHAMLGWALLFFQTLFMAMMVVLDSYLIDPAQSGVLRGVLNPPFLPLLLHRLIGNVSWTALVLAAFAALRMARSGDEGERAFQSWAARINLRIGVGTGILMPVAGFALLEVLRTSVPRYFGNLVASPDHLFVFQAALLGMTFVAANVALAWERPLRFGADGVGRLCVGLAILLFAVGLLPASVLGPDIYWIRYAAIGAGLVVTLIHLLVRSAPLQRSPVPAPAPGAAAVLPFSAHAVARRALLACAVFSVMLALLMGYMKETARGPYAINGELTQQDAHGQWNPQGIYP
ncbi:MAG TPA: cytochrome ubiquinol oxidase subunit I [Candidatus Angelobacter sp.]|nr:cytochrome ubiquinol oxidase subunit I [Candidatus Angelobacter sp.]